MSRNLAFCHVKRICQRPNGTKWHGLARQEKKYAARQGPWRCRGTPRGPRFGYNNTVARGAFHASPSSDGTSARSTSMRRWFAVAAVAVACLFLTPTVHALVARPFPLSQKVAVSDAVVVGRVVTLEEKAVEVAQAPNAAKAAYTIANIKIDDGLVGTKGLTNIRVGFIPTAAGNPAGGRPVIRRPGVVIPNLTAGQEGCFFLTKHLVGDFYVITPG